MSKPDGTSSDYGAALLIQIPNGLSNENGIFFNDDSHWTKPGAAITFYDTYAGNSGEGGIHFKTSNN